MENHSNPIPAEEKISAVTIPTWRKNLVGVARHPRDASLFTPAVPLHWALFTAFTISCVFCALHLTRSFNSSSKPFVAFKRPELSLPVVNLQQPSALSAICTPKQSTLNSIFNGGENLEHSVHKQREINRLVLKKQIPPS